ncbi:MAG: YlxR family protein [Eubacteriaceae bacterium]|nr:YlxR family protein [Eubacteriaceae bacterium]
MKKTPMRTCIICRNKTDKRSLNRIVRTPEGEVLFDATGKKNGRGSYVCSNADCLELVKHKKKIASALQCEAPESDLITIMHDINEYLSTKSSREGQK